MNTAHTLKARIPIWSPGKYTSLGGKDYEFTPEHLEATAKAYAPAVFAAPWVKGHPQADDPALGWAESLEWDGQLLWARSDRIDPQFAEEVRAGRYARISPRFYEPDAANNPVPGTYYLRHIGWLGAAAPANTGLPAPEFAAVEGCVSFADGPAPTENLFQSSAASPMRGGLQIQPSEEASMNAAFAEREAQINTREQKIAEREAALARQEQERREAECASFAERLSSEGRILPRDQHFVAALLAITPDDQQLAFAEGDGQVSVATGERLRAFLNGLPPQVDYQERSAMQAETQEPGAAFAAPPGYSVDQSRAELHRKALAYQQQHSCDYATAAQAVGA